MIGWRSLANRCYRRLLVVMDLVPMRRCWVDFYADIAAEGGNYVIHEIDDALVLVRRTRIVSIFRRQT